jgi:hypothetical protein
VRASCGQWLLSARLHVKVKAPKHSWPIPRVFIVSIFPFCASGDHDTTSTSSPHPTTNHEDVVRLGTASSKEAEEDRRGRTHFKCLVVSIHKTFCRAPVLRISRRTCNFNDQISVLVGPDEQFSLVHKDMICAESKFFAAACSER